MRVYVCAIFHSSLSCFISKLWSRTQLVVFGDAFSLVKPAESWYGHWEPLNDADKSWTWSSSQKGDGEWKLVTRKRKKWTSGTVSPGVGNSSSTSSASSVDKSAIKAHRTFLEVVLGDSGSQPTKTF